MEIRPGLPSDAIEASAVLRRSITELCGADHGGDNGKIAVWTANKTPEEWLSWLSQEGVLVCVAVLENRIAGVGAVTFSGAVMLNYVSPDARFSGVSKALLASMEVAAQAHGAVRCTLESTKTAYKFYQAAGYSKMENDCVAGGWMAKSLPADPTRSSGACRRTVLILASLQ